MKTIFETQSTIPHRAPLPALGLIKLRNGLKLTFREQRAVYLLTEGWDDYEIAWELDLTESTLNNFLLRICQNLGVSDRVELLFYVLSHPCEHGIPSEINSKEEKRKILGDSQSSRPAFTHASRER